MGERWFEMSIVTSVIHFVYSHRTWYSKEQSTMFFFLFFYFILFLFFILSVIIKICSCLGVTAAQMSAGK